MAEEKVTAPVQEPAPEESAPQETAAAPRPGIREILCGCADFVGKHIWIVMLVLSIGLVGYYVLFPSRQFFHSDTTDTLMWAIASYESGELFAPDFNYACLLPFSTSLVMTALIPIFGISMTTHVLGMLVFFLCFAGSLIWMCRKMKWSWHWTSVMTAIVLFVLSGSEKLREIYWGHTIYYSLGVLFLFVGLALLFHHMDLGAKMDSRTEFDPKDKTDYKLLAVTLLICFWFILTCTNQLIAMVIFAIPLMAALFCERWLDSGSELLCKKNRRALLLFVVMGAGMLAGYMLTSILADGVSAGYEGAFSSYSPMNEWLNNLLKFPEQWITLFGVNVHANEPLLSAASIQNLLMLLASVVILVLPLIALCCYNKIEDAKLRILILSYWFMTALIMLGYICGKLSSANWRLSPIVAMSTVVSVAFFRWAASRVSMQRVISVLMIPVVMVTAINAYGIAKMSPTAYKDAVLYQLVDTLEAYGLDYGYANFWRANSITVISDCNVECRSVDITTNGVIPYHYQNFSAWFEDQPNQDRYFLLMTDIEKNDLLASDSLIPSIPHAEIAEHGYYIWVFEQNIVN